MQPLSLTLLLDKMPRTASYVPGNSQTYLKFRQVTVFANGASRRASVAIEIRRFFFACCSLPSLQGMSSDLGC